MKALIYKQKNKLADFGIRLTDVADPELRKTDLLIRVKATAINPGDTQFRRSVNPKAGEYIILGYEYAGIVEQAGAETSGFKAGDKVFGIADPSRHGSYAELLAVDFRTVANFPDFAPFTHVAAAPLTALTAWQAVFRNYNQLPDDVKTVLVVGAAGGVGSMALQLLKARTDVKVIATASRPESAEWCRQMGADLVINHNEDVRAQLKEAGIKEIDMIFSVNGLTKSISWIKDAIRPYGYLAIVDLKEAIDFSPLMNKSVNIFLETVFTAGFYNHGLAQQGENLKELADLISLKKIKTPARIVLKGMTEANIREAHTILEKGDMIGKIVIDFEPAQN